MPFTLPVMCSASKPDRSTSFRPKPSDCSVAQLSLPRLWANGAERKWDGKGIIFLRNALSGADARPCAVYCRTRLRTQKLAAFLLEMTQRKPADEMIELVMTRQDIADYLGLTIETVSRTFSQLERDGIIALTTSRRICLTNRAALRRLNS